MRENLSFLRENLSFLKENLSFLSMERKLKFSYFLCKYAAIFAIFYKLPILPPGNGRRKANHRSEVVIT